MSGASPESVSRLLADLAQYGTYYLRLSRFSLQSAHKKGLVFQVGVLLALNRKLPPARVAIRAVPLDRGDS